MAAVRILLLAVGVAGAIARPFRLPAWAAPVLCGAVDLGVGGITVEGARRALDPLADPIGFLLAAVPLALLLDQLGFFRELGDLMTGSGRGTGGLWVLGALVTTVLNLDAAVVLLTPLYVAIARRSGRSPVTLAFQPVLLALLASSALPVSNLTNLIAVSWTGATTLEFVTHLAAPSLVATAVGWWRYRRVLDPERVQPGDAAAAAVGGTGVQQGRPARRPAGGTGRRCRPAGHAGDRGLSPAAACRPAANPW